ncbi:hypothetical protein EX895_003333 [Sporisorium graminicola]|uniref:Uncharacterized protein n=1 Tax=Sporisorium graminicola TaxID=280036 RepID=A0A4U7KY35_9BASI|nr:hypothetical protein EX895_003333 [Sporisorium graminicola]TKY87752.1 hypothetical protein EX895_003333 [Sporisorium graminicola]
MQDSHPPASAPSSSSLAVESQSDLEPKPTWAQISFDDDFDLNLAASPNLGATKDLWSTSAQSPKSLSQGTAAATPPAPTYSDTSIPVHPNEGRLVQQDRKISLSPESANKALPQLPAISATAPTTVTADAETSDRLQPSRESPASVSTSTLPVSTSFVSTAHSRKPSSQDGARTPKPPGTPPVHSFASPIVTAATPEQPQRFDLADTPTAHRRQNSGNVLSDRRQAEPPSRPVSSADAYMKPIETLQSENSSRPGTAMSHLSGSNWMHDGPGNRSSVGTSSSTPMNQAKRASVLSFQTANSAGFTSGDEARASDRDHLPDKAFATANDSAPAQVTAAASAQPTVIRPWLNRGASGYGTSPDERFIPGGLPGSFWDEPASQTRTTIPVVDAAAAASTASTPTQLDVQSGLADVITNHGNTSNGDLRGSRESAATNPESIPALAPINTQGLAPASPNAPLSSTTIAAPSDETAQAIRRSPDLVRDRQPYVPFPVDAAAPLPPAKDVRPVQTVAPVVSYNSQRGGVGQSFDQTAGPAPAGNLVPPPLPSETGSQHPPFSSDMLMNGPADHRPVSDYRKKPLADISPAQKAAGLAHLQAQAKAAKQQASMDRPSHTPPPTNPPNEAPPIPVLERGRRKSNASLTANVALAQAAAASTGAPRGDAIDRPDTPSAESASQESSAPPDGEIEARAEWERRRRMKPKNGRKQSELSKPQKGRSDTFKSQLRPLQLVPADNNLNSFAARNGIGARANGDRTSLAPGDRNASALTSTSADASRQTYSTQQLQKLQAREQRRSVGAFSAAMAAANVVSSGSNGPYPVFASPNTGPQKVGSRQYPGLMAQRSLVPPFELQHRPDGLPSGLIGPDGVRRSLNDPEVCLECMMRDEDMIDIRVVGEGIWERESDKDFEEAVRLEAEEAAANANGGAYGPSGSSGHGDSLSSHRDSRGSRRPRKKIGKGEPLTVERLKLHTQMNPPASSFRWRTLQTFLAVQAKYIAMEQQRMRLEAEKKTRQNTDSMSSRGSMIMLDAPAPATAQQPERGLSSPFAPPREASTAIASVPARQSILQTSKDDSGLTPQEKQEKERDVAAAQAARKKMTAGAVPPPISTTTPPLGMPVYPVTPLQTRTLPKAMPVRSGSDPEEQLSGLAVTGGVVTPNSGRRVPFGSAQAARAASVQDLRSAADASRSATYPPSPADSLMPPSRSMIGASPTGTPSRLANRSGASQLSLMHSGSMIDMHVAQEDRAEHRLNQNGFLPATPLGVESPAALNPSFYGFPGDGESSLPDAAAFERSRMVSGDGYVDPMAAGPRGLDLDRDDSFQRKKKGFRGLFSKLTGNSGGPSRENTGGPAAGGSLNGSIASRNASKRSQGSAAESPGARQNSFSADRSLDAISPPLNGMLSKARKSTSSFFRNGTEPDFEPRARALQQGGSNSIFQNPPGMTSQNSLDLGPFQPASPQANALGSPNGRMTQQQQQRKAPNPLMQKYLNSPSPQTQASPVSSPVPMVQSPLSNGRMSSFASMRDLRPSALQSIPDVQQGVNESDPRKSMRSSGGSASLRKELPSMPSPADDFERQRTTSIGAAGGVRNSVLANLSPMPAGQGTNADTTYGTIPDDASINSNGPRRPPRNPRRRDGSLDQPGLRDANGRGSDGPLSAQRDFPLQGRSYSEAYTGAIGSPIGTEQRQNKKSIFRLPFGRKKRESTFGAADKSNPSIVIGGADGFEPQPQPRSMSSSFLPKLRSRKSYSGLGVPKPSFQAERQRVLSSPAHDASDAGLPPRSQSAFGMAPTQRFMSMDLPRRSMNVGRANARNRLSTVQYGADDDEEDEDEDDEMEREPGYEAEFERYAQEAAEERYLTTGARGAKDVSFGRKSLNLLREGFKMPLRTVSGDQKKQR